MHELAICQSLLAQVEEIARENEAGRVSVITVQIGPLSGVVPALMKRTFTVARRGTRAANAKLVMEETQARIRCRGCGSEATVPGNKLLCPACGDFQTSLIGGDELILKTVTLNAPEQEEDEADRADAMQQEYRYV